MWRRAALWIGLAVVCHGAAVRSQTNTAAAGPSNLPWTLENAIAFAVKSSPDARVAESRIRAAEGLLRQADASFWPRLEFLSSYARMDQPIGVFASILNQHKFSPLLDFNHPPEADDLNVKGLVTVPLFAGGQNVAGRRAALAEKGAAQQQSEAVKKRLEFEVARAFFTVLKDRDLNRSADASVKALESNINIAQKRFESGTILKSDLLDFDVRLAQARESQAMARNSLALAEQSLRTLLGLETGEFNVATVGPELAVPEGDDFSGRAELRSAEYHVRAAQANVRRAQGGYLPNVDAFGSYDYDEGWELGGSGKSWTAGVLLHWNLWDGQKNRGKVETAKAELTAAQEEQRQMRLNIGFEVSQARLNLKEANERLAVTEKVVAHATESAELTRSRFRSGLALSSQVLDAESALTAAQMRRAQVEADRTIAIAALRRALGLGQMGGTAK